ncbi:MAG: type VI secretion system tube protein Hcp [Desulfatitalea sp.]
MAFDAFIQIDGIEGESTDHKHAGWIEVLSYNLAMSQPVSKSASSVGGASAGRVSFQPFAFTKLIDGASPALAMACAAGTHIDQVLIELCRAGQEKLTFMEYRLTNSLISSVSACTGDPRVSFPMELVKIYFGRIEWRHIRQNRRGGGSSGHVAAGWNLERNRKM